MPDEVLTRINILNLLGVTNEPEDQQSHILAEAQKAVIINFLDNVLPSVISKEDLDTLVEEIDKMKSASMPAEDSVKYFDNMLKDLFVKYPNLMPAFVDSINEYKKILMKTRIERFQQEETFNKEETDRAIVLYTQENWSELYELIVSKYPKG